EHHPRAKLGPGARRLGLPVDAQAREEVVALDAGRLVEALVAAVAVDVDAGALHPGRGPDALRTQLVYQHAGRIDATAAQQPLPLCRPPATPDARPAEVHHGVDALERTVPHPALVRVP